MNASQPPFPDWISKSKVNVPQYVKLMDDLTTKPVDRLFKVHQLLLYVFLGTIMSEFIWEPNMIGATLSLISVIGVSITTIGIFSKLSDTLTLGQLKDLFLMLPTLSKLFVFGSIVMIIVLSTGTVAELMSNIPSSFVELMYSSLPVTIVIFAITAVYPLSRLRNYLLYKRSDEATQYQDNSSENIDKDSVNTVHKQGELEMAEIESEGGKEPHQMSSEELLNEMTNGRPHKVIMDQMASSKNNPMALAPQDIDILEEHNCLEEYVEEYGASPESKEFSQ